MSIIVAVEYPDLVSKLILVSSGPFEAKYAERIMPTRLSHLTRKEGERVQTITDAFQRGDINDISFQEFGGLMSKADSFDPTPGTGEGLEPQSDIYQSVWKEADELRSSGKLLEYAQSVICPVVVIHGAYDPHPYEGVKLPLMSAIKDCKFHLLENCGHHPWFERQAKDKFYEILINELV